MFTPNPGPLPRLARLLAAGLLAAMVAPAGCAEPPPPKPPPPPVEAPVQKPADTDSDGIADLDDKCPNEAEDRLPPAPGDGCKTTDADGDSVVNENDKCPDEKEDGRPPDAADGCLTRDADGDGVLGEADKCPDKPETINGFEDEDGCPDVPPRVQVTKTEVKINEKILFAFGKATIDPKSDDLLKNIADVINDNPQIEFIEIAGHADNVGSDKVNQTLTRQRAEAVAKALAKRGVEPRRMSAQGYGFYCPIEKGDSEEVREKNRRVEFKILRVSGVETGVAVGCEQASQAGVKPAVVPKNAPTQAALEKAKNTKAKGGKPKVDPGKGPPKPKNDKPKKK